MRFTAWRFNRPRPPPPPPPPAPPPPPPNIPPGAPPKPPPPPPGPPKPPCPPPGPPRPPPGPCPPGPPSPEGFPGTNPFCPNPPGPFPARPWPTVPCNKNESEVALEPAPAGSSAAICVPSFEGVLAAPAGPPAPSSVRSVCSKPPPARPALIALLTPAGTWPPRPPAPCLPGPPALVLPGFAAPLGGRGLRGGRGASGFEVSSAKVATRRTIGMGPGGTTGTCTTSDALAKPNWLASTRYGPVGICGNSNLPDSSVQLSQVLLVSVLIRWTVAAGTGVPSGVRTTPLAGGGGLTGCCAKFKFPLASQNSRSARIFPWRRLKMTFPRADQLAARWPVGAAVPWWSGGRAAEIPRL